MTSVLIKWCEGDCQLNRKQVGTDEDEKAVPLLQKHAPVIQVMEKEPTPQNYLPPLIPAKKDETLVDYQEEKEEKDEKDEKEEKEEKKNE